MVMLTTQAVSRIFTDGVTFFSAMPAIQCTLISTLECRLMLQQQQAVAIMALQVLFV
jgi:hypothetical protein